MSGGPNRFKHFFFKGKKVDEEKVEEEILSMVEEGHEQGAILSDEAEMISNIFEFGDKEAKDVMTSRQMIVGIEATTTVEEAMTFMLDNNYSRYPIYEGDIDSIIGILHLKDAMIAYMKDEKEIVKSLGREPFYITPTKSISTLFSEMQTNKVHMAVVVDEYGQTEGIVAMEDILEVIVGNIFDEYDEVQHDIIKLGDENSYLVKGMTRLDELGEILDIDFPDEDIDTVNGFMLYQLGRLPMEHENIDIVFQGYSFKPIDIHDKMIIQVKITRLNITKEEDIHNQ